MHGSVVLLLLFMHALGVQDPESQQTPRMQFEALQQKFEEAALAIGAPARSAKTDDERRNKAIEAMREFDKLVPPFLDLAKKAGTTLTGVELQAARYSAGFADAFHAHHRPLPSLI